MHCLKSSIDFIVLISRAGSGDIIFYLAFAEKVSYANENSNHRLKTEDDV